MHGTDGELGDDAAVPAQCPRLGCAGSQIAQMAASAGAPTPDASQGARPMSSPSRTRGAGNARRRSRTAQVARQGARWSNRVSGGLRRHGRLAPMTTFTPFFKPSPPTCP